MSSSDIAAWLAAAMAASGWVAAFLQLRTFRLYEKQVHSQLESIHGIITRIETERREREVAIEQRRISSERMEERFRQKERMDRKNASAGAVAHWLTQSRLSLLISILISVVQRELADEDKDLDEFLNRAADLAIAIAGSSELSAMATESLQEWRENDVDKPDEPIDDDFLNRMAKFCDALERGNQPLADASKNFCAAMEKIQTTADRPLVAAAARFTEMFHRAEEKRAAATRDGAKS